MMNDEILQDILYAGKNGEVLTSLWDIRSFGGNCILLCAQNRSHPSINCHAQLLCFSYKYLCVNYTLCNSICPAAQFELIQTVLTQ